MLFEVPGTWELEVRGTLELEVPGTSELTLGCPLSTSKYIRLVY